MSGGPSTPRGSERGRTEQENMRVLISDGAASVGSHVRNLGPRRGLYLTARSSDGVFTI